MKNTITTLLICAAAVVPAMAQQHPTKQNTDDKLVSIINTDTVSGNKAYKVFSDNAPVAANIPGAPKFAIVGKNEKFYLGIGGSLKGTISYDFGDPITNPNEFATSAIDMNPTKGNNGLVQLSAQQTSLFVNFVALPDNPNKIGVYISANFLGNNYTPQLQYAYVKYRGFTVGYDYSLFSDMGAIPPTIDYEGPNAATAIPNAVLDYRHSFGKNWSVGVGLELPEASYTNSQYTYTVNQKVPDIPAYVQYSWNGGNSWFRVSGILRNMAYHNTLTDKNNHAVGWGIKASGTAAILPGLTGYWQAVYGKGVTSYIQDLNGGGLDLVPDAAENGHLKPVEAWGGYAGLQYNFTPNLYCSATYSHVRTYADKYQGGQTAWGDQYKYAQYAVGNVFYNVNKLLTVGVEYIWGRKVDMNGLSHHDNRLQAMVQVNF